MQGALISGRAEKQAGWSLLDDNKQRGSSHWGKWARNIPTGRRKGYQKLTLPSLPSAIPTSTVRFIILCCLWYMSSAMSSNTGKAILNQFRYPVTLTFVQFGFIAGYCLLLMSPLFRVSKLRRPSLVIIRSTLPMAAFQVGGHIFSSVAMARISVSTVHTIKALSPLFTVAAYALLFRVRYSLQTYISLLPLTLGVMMACSSEFSASNILGLLSAFGSAIVFVSSNIFFKKIMPSSSGSSPSVSSHKLDKLNLLLYSSGFAFILMIPVWFYSDFSALLSPVVVHPPHPASHGILYYFFWNGLVHFGQNIIAFAVLSTTSPVTYSIASLIKRIAVIIIAIMWFNQTVHGLQAVGIISTSVGLWMYNRAKGDVEKGERKILRIEAERQLILPLNEADRKIMDPTTSPRLSGEMHDRTVKYSHSGQTMTTSMQAHVSPTASHPPRLHLPPSSMQIHTGMSKYNHRPNPITSPIRSYPSPPPSLDSPPDDTKAFHIGFRSQTIAQRA